MRLRAHSFVVILLVSLLCSCHRLRHRPNVLVITIDTTRADHLGCYGYSLARTPAIDRLAAEGVRCSNAVSSAPITMPSHSSIFTGLFPTAHGVRDNGAYALGDGAVTLAERLRDAGYTTHAFVSAIVLSRRYNLDQGFETYDDELWAEDDPKMFMIRERQAPRTADRFLKWFGEWDQSRSKPFFTWIHFFDPHQPYRPSIADAALAVSPYDAEIAGVDHQIERILGTLRGRDLLDDTLVILTADHGESLGEHGEKTHAIFVYDATVHVPLLIRYPRVFQPRVYDAPVRSVDIVPTVLSILGLKGGEATDGRNLEAALRGKETPPQLPQYSESLLSEVGFGMAPLYAIRENGMKYIRAPRAELYDLRKDPQELHNLQPEQPRVAAKMDTDLAKLMQGSEAHAVKAAANPMTRETEESLRALGYLAARTDRTSMQGMDPKDALPIHTKLEDARHFAQKNKWPQAEKLLREVLAVTPRNVSAINILGMSAMRVGDFDTAIKYYKDSLAIDPDQFRIHAVLGSIAMTQGDFERSEQEYGIALHQNPNFTEAMASIGFVESLKGNDAKAEEWYRKATAADPTFPRVYRRLGDLNYEHENWAKAYENYMQVLKLTPEDIRATLQAGNSARRLGRLEEAERLFRKAHDLRPDSWIATYNLACLRATNGKPAEALEMLTALAAHREVPLGIVMRDPDLQSMRALPGFPALQAKLTDHGDDEDEPDAAD